MKKSVSTVAWTHLNTRECSGIDFAIFIKTNKNNTNQNISLIKQDLLVILALNLITQSIQHYLLVIQIQRRLL
ncbi:MAG: hypothetical protein ABSG15_02290 [FCB group bacterium]|jgi:hypothetical protein